MSITYGNFIFIYFDVFHYNGPAQCLRLLRKFWNYVYGCGHIHECISLIRISYSKTPFLTLKLKGNHDLYLCIVSLILLILTDHIWKYYPCIFIYHFSFQVYIWQRIDICHVKYLVEEYSAFHGGWTAPTAIGYALEHSLSKRVAWCIVDHVVACSKGICEAENPVKKYLLSASICRCNFEPLHIVLPLQLSIHACVYINYVICSERYDLLTNTKLPWYEIWTVGSNGKFNVLLRFFKKLNKWTCFVDNIIRNVAVALPFCCHNLKKEFLHFPYS